MVKPRYTLFVLLIVAVGLWIGFRLFQSDERRIKKQFDALSEWVSKEPDENTIAMAHKMQRLGTLFDKRCSLKFPADSFSGDYTSEEISSYAARARSRFSKLSLDFYDLDIRFPEDGIARVNLTARLTGRTRSTEHFRDTRELVCTLRKMEKKWLFQNIEVVEVLNK
jgi:hypothetical protein